MREPGGSGLPFYSRRARLRGLASAAAREAAPDTRRVPVRQARCAAGAYPLGMQRRPSQRGARAGVSSGRGRRIAVGRAGEAPGVGLRARAVGPGQGAPPDSPMAAGRALCCGGYGGC